MHTARTIVRFKPKCADADATVRHLAGSWRPGTIKRENTDGS
jgi:hypothetical protein